MSRTRSSATPGTLQAYHRAEAAAQKLLASARKDGLKAAFAEQFPALATRPVTTRPSTRPATPEVEMFEQDAITRARAMPAYFLMYSDSLTMPTHLLGVQETERSAPLAKRILDAAFDLTETTTATQPAANRAAVVDLPEQKAFVLVEVLNHKPAAEPDFAKAKESPAGWHAVPETAQLLRRVV